MISTCWLHAQMTNQIILILSFWHSIKHANFFRQKTLQSNNIERNQQNSFSLQDSPKRRPIILLLRWQINVFRSFRTVIPCLFDKICVSSNPFNQFSSSVCQRNQCVKGKWKSSCLQCHMRMREYRGFVCVCPTGGWWFRKFFGSYFDFVNDIFICCSLYLFFCSSIHSC